MELFELGIKAAQEGLAKGEFSSRDLVQAIIDRYHARSDHKRRDPLRYKGE